MEITNSRLHQDLMNIYSNIRDYGAETKKEANWISYSKYPTDLQNFLAQEHTLGEIKNKFISLLTSKFLRIVPLNADETWLKVKGWYNIARGYLGNDGKTWSWCGMIGDTYEIISKLTSNIVTNPLTFQEISLIERCFNRAELIFGKSKAYASGDGNKYNEYCDKLRKDYEEIFNPIINQYWELRAQHPVALYPNSYGEWKEWDKSYEWTPYDFDYHDTPSKVYQAWEFEPQKGMENIHYGCEREMVWDSPETFYEWLRYCIENKILTEKWEFIWNRDGSLPGCDCFEELEDNGDCCGREIITRPMTEAEYKEWSPKFEASLDKFGVDRNDSSCGGHLHIEKAFLSDEEIFTKIIPSIMGLTRDKFIEIFGREPNGYCKIGLEKFKTDATTKYIKVQGAYVNGKWVQKTVEEADTPTYDIVQTDRYCAGNLQHAKTVEVRAYSPDKTCLEMIDIAKKEILKDVKLLEEPRCQGVGRHN